MSCMTYVWWTTSLNGQQFTINDFSLASQRTLARGVREGGLCSLLVNPVAFVHSSERLDEPSRVEKAHAWWDAMVVGSEPIVVSMIDYGVQDVVITSCVDGYNDTSIVYMINILA
jgi:hypothetical protein